MGWMKDKRRREREAKQLRKHDDKLWSSVEYKPERLDRGGLPTMPLANNPSSYVPGEFIVIFTQRPNISKHKSQSVKFNDVELDQLSERHNIINFKNMAHRNYILLKSSESDVSNAIEEFRLNSNVVTADFNHIDTQFSSRINMPINHYAPSNDRYDTQFNLHSMRLHEAWSYGTGDPEVRIAVLDSGLGFHDAQLPSSGWERDLYNLYNPLYGDYFEDVMQLSAYGWVGSSLGYPVVNPFNLVGSNHTRDEDCAHWHGTMVAAVTSGNHVNSDTPAGICPGCELFALKRRKWDGDCYSGTTEDTINGILVSCGPQYVGSDCACYFDGGGGGPGWWQPYDDHCWSIDPEPTDLAFPYCHQSDGSCSCVNIYHHPRTIINMSYGTPSYNSALHSLINYEWDEDWGPDGEQGSILENCILVAAAGNLLEEHNYNSHYEYPAAHPEVVAVGAVNYHWADEYNDVLIRPCHEDPVLGTGTTICDNHSDPYPYYHCRGDGTRWSSLSACQNSSGCSSGGTTGHCDEISSDTNRWASNYGDWVDITAPVLYPGLHNARASYPNPPVPAGGECQSHGDCDDYHYCKLFDNAYNPIVSRCDYGRDIKNNTFGHLNLTNSAWGTYWDEISGASSGYPNRLGWQENVYANYYSNSASIGFPLNTSLWWDPPIVVPFFNRAVSSHTISTTEDFPGTSAAAPQIVGILGLLWSQFPERSSQEIIDILYTSAVDIDDKNPGFEGLLGHGRADAMQSISMGYSQFYDDDSVLNREYPAPYSDTYQPPGGDPYTQYIGNEIAMWGAELDGWDIPVNEFSLSEGGSGLITLKVKSQGYKGRYLKSVVWRVNGEELESQSVEPCDILIYMSIPEDFSDPPDPAGTDWEWATPLDPFNFKFNWRVTVSDPPASPENPDDRERGYSTNYTAATGMTCEDTLDVLPSCGEVETEPTYFNYATFEECNPSNQPCGSPSECTGCYDNVSCHDSNLDSICAWTYKCSEINSEPVLHEGVTLNTYKGLYAICDVDNTNYYTGTGVVLLSGNSPIAYEREITTPQDIKYYNGNIACQTIFSNPATWSINNPTDPDRIASFQFFKTSYETDTITATVVDSQDNEAVFTLYAYKGDYQTMSVEYSEGWNLVGWGLDTESNNYNIFGPDVIPGTLYDFSGTYTSESDPTPGEGYWLNFSDSGTVNIIGSLISSIEINLSQGWNLISGISEPVNIEDIVDPEGIIVPESIYGYSGTYTPEVVIEPWKGYWINVNADGTITLNQS